MIAFSPKIDREKLAGLPKVDFPGRIVIVNTLQGARLAVNYLNTQDVVGVDTETRPSFRKGMKKHKVALLQIASADVCFLFRLTHFDIPDFLEDFLQNQVLKVGLSLKDDFDSIRHRNSGDLAKGNWLDLQDYVPHFGIEEKSLQKIYAVIFGKKISKAQRLTNWEAEPLTFSQQCYAATDAWACLHIYQYLEDLKKKNEIKICGIQ